MADDRDDLIRFRAYEIWEAEGAPDGRHDEHWTRAAQEIGEFREDASAEPDEDAMPAVDEAAAPAIEPSQPEPVEAEPAAPKRGRKAADAPAPAKRRRKKDG